MAAEAVRGVELLACAVALAAGLVLVFGRLAPGIGLLDVPGGRKSHDHPVPLVGGLSIFVALLGGAELVGVSRQEPYFLFALSLIIAIGLWDDVRDLAPRVKIGIQMLACAIMIWGAGIELHSVGDLLGWRVIGLSVFAIPLTIFAVVGVANSVNMLDGVDGLAGTIGALAFGWYALVAKHSGLESDFETALLFFGAIAGFLLFNLRFPWQPRAKVFLGDAGSLMIGFALGWFAIDLTQGENRTFPPIAALWVLLLPLADCVSLMLRRIAKRENPFIGDRQHIHHYLLARGFTHGQTLAILAAASTLFGAIGYFGWLLRAPEPLLFWPFFFGFFAYHYWIGRAWRGLERTNIETAAFAPLMNGQIEVEEEESVSVA